jgi:hypothetical protein
MICHFVTRLFLHVCCVAYLLKVIAFPPSRSNADGEIVMMFVLYEERR